MRAVIKPSAAPGLTVTDAPIPVPRADEVLLQVEVASVCGTDGHIFRWDAWAAARVRPPLIIGHELCGRPVDVGSAVDGIAADERYAVESHVICGTCVACSHGAFHACVRTEILGVDRTGGLAEYVAVPAKNLRRVDQSLAPELVAFMEPLGNAVHACDQGELEGTTVAILGCGPIGLACIVIARARGAERVVGADVSPWRIDLARRVGADDVVLLSSRNGPGDLVKVMGRESDCVLEMSGAPAAFTTALEIVRPGGWISVLGLGTGTVPIDPSAGLVMRGVTVHGVVGREIWRTWEHMDSLLAGGADFRPILTHHVDLLSVVDGFELMLRGECGKVVVHTSAHM